MGAVERIAIGVEPADEADVQQRARALARDLSLPIIDISEKDPARKAHMLLLITPRGLALRALHGPNDLTAGNPFCIDLRRIDTTSGPGSSLRQPLLRAVGLRKGDARRPTVLDATAGFGEDAWLLACIGCDVLAIERDPVVAALLSDALERARHDVPDAVDRLRVTVADSTAVLRAIAAGEPDARAPLAGDAPPQVVYLDPMFATGRKTLERKPMRLLRQLVGDADEAQNVALLDAALAAAQRRVVVKRPAKAPPLADRAPHASHPGSSVRYDVYSTAAQ